MQPSMKLSAYSLPAFIQDFPLGSEQYTDLSNRWSINITGWIAQAMPGSPSYFYDPLTTDIPAGSASAPVTWNAFPGRLLQYFSANTPIPPSNPYNFTLEQLFELADTGYYNKGEHSFPNIPTAVCPHADWTSELKPFGPYGPRGWLDEYCEWSAARDTHGNLLRVDFCCENPEYWNTLWQVSPQRVAELYQSTLNAGAPQDRSILVSVDDLVLLNENGNPVIDPSTGRPAYNPLNKWNSGPVANRIGVPAEFSGGAIHLTSTPNTLQTELGLAGAATVQYQPPGGTGNNDPQALICCGNYGQEYRHSDPHIGQAVNQVVGGQALGTTQYVCLANPVGLYIQMPPKGVFDFGPKIVKGKDVPADADASEIWQVIRGSANVADPVTCEDFPGNMILHAACQIPLTWLQMNPNLTLADMTISGQSIQWGGQIALQFNIGLFARPLPASTNPPQEDCSSSASSAGQPLQCLFAAIWNGFYPQNEPCPTGTAMSLASNTTFIAPQLTADGTTQELVLTVTTVNANAKPSVQILLPDGSGPDPAIQVSVTELSQVTYAVPGNSYPSASTALALSVLVPNGAKSGLRGVQVSGKGIAGGKLLAAINVLK